MDRFFMVLRAEWNPFAILSAVEAKAPSNPVITVPETEVAVSCHFLLKRDLKKDLQKNSVLYFSLLSPLNLRCKPPPPKKDENGSWGFSVITVRTLSPHGKTVGSPSHLSVPNYSKELHPLFCHLVFIFKISLRGCDWEWSVVADGRN